jgi:hypothetical protein
LDPTVDPSPLPTPDEPLNPNLALPWGDDDTGNWRKRIQVAKDGLQAVIDDGKANVERYTNRYLKKNELSRDTVSIPQAFSFTETKKPQLFYRVPEVQLTGKRPAADAVAPVVQKVLNDYLGPEHINVRIAMAEILFDEICATGYGVVKVGYESATVPVEMPGEPAAPGLPPAEPQIVQVPVYENYYVRRISPGRLLRPIEFHGLDYDTANWIGFTFTEDVPPNTPGATTTDTKADDQLLSKPAVSAGTGRTVATGVEIWYRRAAFDPAVKDPQEIAVFVLMDGDDTPREHRPSPLQRRGQAGKWIGMTGFPVKVLKIRYVSDSADAPSDVSITRNLSDEQSRGRTQLLRARDRKMPTVIYDNTRPGIRELIDKIEHNDSNAFVGVPGDPRDIFHTLDKGSVAQESYNFNDYVERDIEKAWALGSNQQGVNTDSARTATELSLVQEATDTRLAAERDAVTYFFTDKIARNVLGLLQLFATADSFVRIVGPDGAVQWQKWNADSIQGEFSFNIKINSQLRPDSAADLKKIMDVVNFSAKSPYVNQMELWRTAMQQWGFDPNRIIRQPDPPKEEGPRLAVSMSLSPADFVDPRTRVYAIALAKAAGVEVPMLQLPGDVAQLSAPPPAAAGVPMKRMGNQLTPGALEEADTLSKHKALETGRLDGAGSSTGAAPSVQ